MFTTGSKLLIGSSALAAVAAVVYGVSQDGVMGTIGLVSAAVALAFLATVNVLLGDSNVLSTEPAVVESSSAARRTAPASVWPLGLAVGAMALVLGLVTQQAVFVIGLLIILAAGAEWMAHAWAEGASTDPGINAEVRSRIANSLEFPLLGAVVVGVIVYAFSRIMLWLSKTNTVIAFSVMAALILAIAGAFALRPTVKKGVVAGVSALAVVGIVAGGAAAGIDGERDIEEHETTGNLVAEGICESPEEFEADEKASQTVAAKSSVAAEITLTEAGELDVVVPGGDLTGEAELTLPRSNPTNVIFRNESPEERRLTLDLGTETVTTEEGEDEEVPNQVCTTLVEEGGAQLMTFTIGAPSIASPDGYRFFVPGVDSAEVAVVVP